MHEAGVRVRGLTKIFGRESAKALELLTGGKSRLEVQQQTGTVVGLHDVNFDIYRGEILVVMGLSGSGKSTCLRCLNRLIEPTAGEILIDNVDMRSLSESELRNIRRTRFGMVFQQFALLPHRNILRNVEFGLEIQQVPAAKRAELAMAAIEQVGLKGWDQHYPSQLSGGMQQRAGLARALALNPDFLLMDEAFSALDPLIRRDMQQELVLLQKRVKKTIVFVSHDLDEAIALGGRIVLMKDGHVVQQGTAADFLANPADDYVRRFVEHIDILDVVQAGDVMLRSTDASIWTMNASEALARLRESAAQELVVVCEDGRFRGVLDLHTLQSAGQGEIKLLLKGMPDTVGETSTLSTAVGMLARNQGKIHVICAEGRPKGSITNADLVAALAKRQPIGRPH